MPIFDLIKSIEEAKKKRLSSKKVVDTSIFEPKKPSFGITQPATLPPQVTTTTLSDEGRTFSSQKEYDLFTGKSTGETISPYKGPALKETVSPKENVINRYEEAYAYEDLKKLQEDMAKGGGKLPIKGAKETFKETPPEKYVPFLSAIPDIKKSLELYQSAKRAEKGEETLKDIYTLAKYSAEASRDQTFLAKIASLLINLPAFGGELALTGGLFSAGKKTVEKAIAKTIEKYVGKKSLGLIPKALGSKATGLITRGVGTTAGGTLQTIPARVGEITAGTIQNMIPEYQFTTDELNNLELNITGEGDDLFKAASKSLGNEWVEVVSEHTGGVFDEMAAPVRNKLIKLGLFKSFLKTNPNAKVNDFMKLVNRAGWNGVLQEVGEEYIGAGMRGVLTELGLSEEGWKFPSKEEFAVMLIGFSVPGAAIAVTNKAIGAGTFEGTEPGTEPPGPPGTIPPVPPTGPTTKEVDAFDSTIERDQTGEVIKITGKEGNILYSQGQETNPPPTVDIIKDIVSQVETNIEERKGEVPKSAKEEFKVGDILDVQEKTNMVSPVRIREITGNTLKFTDAQGTDYAGMQRSVVRDLIKGGSWKIVSQPLAKEARVEFDTKGTPEMNKTQLKKEGFDVAALGYGQNYANIETINGKPAVAYFISEDRPHALTGISVQKDFRGKGIATQFLKNLAKDGVLYVQSPNADLTKILKEIGTVSKPDSEDIVTVKLNQPVKESPIKDLIGKKLTVEKGAFKDIPIVTQKEKVKETVKEEPKTIKQIAGSGVTLEQAVATGRKAVGIEKETKAIEEHIIPRVEKAAGKTKETVSKPIKLVTKFDTPERAAKAQMESNILTLLELSQAGYRYKDPTGTWVAVPSTFPDWILEDLRLNSVVQPTLVHIKNGTIPTKVKEVRLYNLINERINTPTTDELNHEVNPNTLFMVMSDQIRREARTDNKKAIETIRKYIPEKELAIRFNDSMNTPSGQLIWARYSKQVIDFVNNPKATAPSHEAIHAILDMFIPDNLRSSYYARILEGKSEKEITDGIKRIQDQYRGSLTGAEARDIYAGEQMAIGFESYLPTQEKKSFISKFFDSIISFFRRIFDPYNAKNFYEDVIKVKRYSGKEMTAGEVAYFKEKENKFAQTTRTLKQMRNELRSDYIGKDTILNYLNRQGITKTDQEIIVETMNEYPGDQIPVGDFIARATAKIMPLTLIRSRTHSTHGTSHLVNMTVTPSDNISKLDAKWETHIWDTPYRHGEAGHFGEDFGKKKIGYEIKKVVDPISNTDLYFVVEKGVAINQDNVNEVVATTAESEKEAKDWIKEHQKSAAEKKSGLFGHSRVGIGKTKQVTLQEIAENIKEEEDSLKTIIKNEAILKKTYDNIIKNKNRIIKQIEASLDKYILKLADMTIGRNYSLRNILERYYESRIENTEKNTSNKDFEIKYSSSGFKGFEYDYMKEIIGIKDFLKGYDAEADDTDFLSIQQHYYIEMAYEMSVKVSGTDKNPVASFVNKSFSKNIRDGLSMKSLNDLKRNSKITISEYKKKYKEFLARPDSSFESPGYYTLELQADPFQSRYEVESDYIRAKNEQKAAEYLIENIDKDIPISSISVDKRNKYIALFSDFLEKRFKIDSEKYYIFISANSNELTFSFFLSDNDVKTSVIASKKKEKEKIKKYISDFRDYADSKVKDLESKRTLLERQFYATGNKFHERIIKEEIRLAANMLVNKNDLEANFYLPTPFTTAIIEGFVNPNEYTVRNGSLVPSKDEGLTALKQRRMQDMPEKPRLIGVSRSGNKLALDLTVGYQKDLSKLRSGDTVDIEGNIYEVEYAYKDNVDDPLTLYQNEDLQVLPYKWDDTNRDPRAGDTIEYEGDEHTVIEVHDDNMEIAKSDRVRSYNFNDYVNDAVNNRLSEAESEIDDLIEKYGPIKTAEKAKFILDKKGNDSGSFDYYETYQILNDMAEADETRTDLDYSDFEESARESIWDSGSEYYSDVSNWTAQGYEKVHFDDRGGDTEVWVVEEGGTVEEVPLPSSGYLADPKMEITEKQFAMMINAYDRSVGKVNKGFDEKINDWEKMVAEVNVKYDLLEKEYLENKDKVTNLNPDGSYVFDYENVLTSDEYKTVIRYYVDKVVPFLKKYRKNVQVFTDKRGIQWYRTPVTEEDKGEIEAYMVKEPGEPFQYKWQIEMPLEPQTTETISKTDIISWIEKTFKVPIRGKVTYKWKSSGRYYPDDWLIRLAKWGELPVAVHELAHNIDLSVLKKENPEGWRKGSHGFQQELANLDYDQKQRRTKEGFAEYLRYKLTTDQAPKLAPIFDKFFDDFLKTKPELKKNLDELRDKLQIWINQGAENRIIHHIDWKGELSETGGVTNKLGKAWRFLQSKFNDEFYVAQKITKEIEKTIGRELRPSKNPAKMMEVSKAKSGAIGRTFVMDKAIDESGNVLGPGLVEILKPIDNKEMKQFIAYWVSKRVINLEERENPVESGFDMEDARFIVNKYKDKGWDEVTAQLTDWSNNLLGWLIRAGGLSEEAGRRMRELNPVYAPFKRVFLDEVQVIRGGGGYVDTGTGIKSIRGSGRPIVNPIESMIAMSTEMIAKAQKLRIASLFADLAYEKGLGGFITEVPAPMTAAKFDATQIQNYINQVTGEIYRIEPGDMLTVFTQGSRYTGKDNVVTIYRDGKIRFYEIHPELYEALKGLDPLKLWPVGKMLAPFSRLLRLGATGLKVSFGGVRNPFRDALSYVVFSLRKLVSIFDPVKGVFISLTTKEGEPTWRFKKLGGALSGQIGLDRGATRNAYDEMLAKKLGWRGKALLVVKHPFETLRDLISVTELGPRSIEMEENYKMYTSEKWLKDHPDWTEEDAFYQALLDAQDVTVNFTKSGQWSKQLNEITAFFNVSIRGPEKMYRSFRERPVASTVKALAWLTMMALVSWWNNKDKDWYKNLEPSYKYNNLFFEVGGNVYRLPVPFELGTIFMSIPQAVMDMYKDKDLESIEGIIAIIKAQIPDPMPSMFGPVWDVSRNKNYLGSPIESAGMQYEYPTERKKDYTSRLAIALSKVVDKVGGRLSPIQIDYLIDAYSGGFLRQFRVSGGELYDLPVLSDLMLRDPLYPKRQLNNFFEDYSSLGEKVKSEVASPEEQLRYEEIKSFYKAYRIYQVQIVEAKANKDKAVEDELYKMVQEELKSYGYD